MVSISKESNGTVKFDYGVSFDPTYYSSLSNVTIQTQVASAIGLNNILITGKGINQVIYFPSLDEINGSPAPADIDDAVALLISDVFNSYQGVAVADSTDEATTVIQFNLLLASLRAAGIIST